MLQGSPRLAWSPWSLSWLQLGFHLTTSHSSWPLIGSCKYDTVSANVIYFIPIMCHKTHCEAHLISLPGNFVLNRDRFRTMINVLGDALAAGIMAHICRKDFPKKSERVRTFSLYTLYTAQSRKTCRAVDGNKQWQFLAISSWSKMSTYQNDVHAEGFSLQESIVICLCVMASENTGTQGRTMCLFLES